MSCGIILTCELNSLCEDATLSSRVLKYTRVSLQYRGKSKCCFLSAHFLLLGTIDLPIPPPIYKGYFTFLSMFPFFAQIVSLFLFYESHYFPWALVILVLFVLFFFSGSCIFSTFWTLRNILYFNCFFMLQLFQLPFISLFTSYCFSLPWFSLD